MIHATSLMLLATTAPTQAARDAYALAPGGWLIMLGSVTFVTSLFAWSLYKVLSNPDTAQHLQAETTIEEPDAADD